MLGSLSLALWGTALTLFLVTPHFERIWFSSAWPYIILASAITATIAIGAAIMAALGNKIWWWSMAGAVLTLLLILGSVAG